MEEEGVIKFYDTKKNFGFITPNNSSKDVFFHQTGLLETVNEGDKVQYIEETGDRGLKAVDIKLV